MFDIGLNMLYLLDWWKQKLNGARYGTITCT